MRNSYFQSVFFSILISIVLVPVAYAKDYYLHNQEDSVIGELDAVVVSHDHTLLDIARDYGLGYNDIKLLNPSIDTWLPDAGQVIELPLQFILPNVERQGIVLNIPEMRLYYFPPVEENNPIKVITYPLGIGRAGWETPYKKTRIIDKKQYPDWRPPESIQREHEEAGDPLPKIVKAGPDNPLGDYALRLGLPAYLIHGTNKPWGIGMRVSHGCIRLYPEDIYELFNSVKIGTEVNIVNMPYKLGEKDRVLYLEIHPPLETITGDEELVGAVNAATAKETVDDVSFDSVIDMIMESVQRSGEYEIHWGIARLAFEEAKGVPVAIGIYTP